MAMIDYGAVVYKNGRRINEGDFFMQDQKTLTKRKTIIFSEEKIKKNGVWFITNISCELVQS